MRNIRAARQQEPKNYIESYETFERKAEVRLKHYLRRGWPSHATSRIWILGVLIGFFLTFLLSSSEGVAGTIASRARRSNGPSESMSSIAPLARTGEGLSDVAFGSGGQRPVSSRRLVRIPSE